MSTDFMFTAPSHTYNRRAVRRMIDELDIHKWVIGFEIGKGGYKHIQGRVRVSKGKDEGFQAIKGYLGDAHIEACSDNWTYERKDGRFLSSEDTPEIRAVRFGNLKENQRAWLKEADAQGDRGITVIFDPAGNHGKSWFVNWMFETNKGFYVPPTIDTVKGLIQWVASGYEMQPYICIDIPRSWKWSPQLYTAIESIKDGLVYDTRYSSKLRNIRGVKVMVFTNEEPKLEALSADRWKIFGPGTLS